jgi:hypothetical protein
LQSLHAREVADPLSGLWLANKIVLIIAGTALLFLHGRLLSRVTRPAGRADVVRIGVWVGLVAILYAASGAAVMVVYAYQNRAHLPYKDIVWVRRQLKLYGPVPMASLFGPAFATWAAPVPTGPGGDSDRAFRIQSLRSALERWPNSLWSDAIAFSLGDDELDKDPKAAARDWMALADRFPTSPYAPHALVEVVRVDNDTVPLETRMAAARRLVRDYSRAPEAERAAELLRDQFPGQVSQDEMLRAALIASDVALDVLCPGWLEFAAELEEKKGDTRRAAELALAARKAGFDLRLIQAHDPVRGPKIGQRRPQIDEAIRDAAALLQRLGQPVPPPPPGIR